MNRKVLFFGAAAFLLAAFAVATFLYKSEKTLQSTQAVERNRANLIRFHSPSIGAADAKVHIVEFLDPACETCSSFYPYVKSLMAANPGQVRLSIRHVAFHRGSDYAVRVLEAARKQGKYWETLEALLASQDYWAPQHTARPDLILNAIGRVGLDLERIKADVNSPEIAVRLQQDMDDAKALEVTKTPEFFVNGRPLPRFGDEELRNLVREELARAYP